MSKLDTLVEVAKNAPPATGVGLKFAGIAIADWTQIALFVWTVFLIIDKWPTIIERMRAFAEWAKGLYGRLKRNPG